MDQLFIERVPAKYILGKFAKNLGVGMAEDIHGEKYPELQRFVRWKTLNTMSEREVHKKLLNLMLLKLYFLCIWKYYESSWDARQIKTIVVI